MLQDPRSSTTLSQASSMCNEVMIADASAMIFGVPVIAYAQKSHSYLMARTHHTSVGISDKSVGRYRGGCKVHARESDRAI